MRTKVKARAVVGAVLMGVVLLAAACSSSSNSSSSTTTTSGSSTSQPGGNVTVTPAMSTEKTSCPTATSCFTVGNVSTVGGGVPGLFQGAAIGVDAYLAYQNSLGGVDGRKFKLLNGDDQLACDNNKALTQQYLPQVIAFVGSFSLYDNCGGQILAAHPDVADVSETLDPTTSKLPNVFSVQPLAPGMASGPLQFFKQKFPSAITKVGTLVTNAGSAPAQWVGERAAMESLGYKIAYQRYYSPLDTDFTPDVLKMEADGVQMVVLIATNDSYGAKLLNQMHTQGFHPQVIWGGASIYSGVSPSDPTIVKDAGGAAVADGVYLEQAQSLYLGEDAKLVPEIATFNKWVHGLDPGFNIDLFTLYGWTSAQLFVQGLKNAGADPTSASLVAALKKITSFNAGGMLATANPAGKQPATCYVLAQIVNGQFQRVDMPSGTTYRCDGHYIHK